MVEQGVIEVEYIPTKDMIADTHQGFTQRHVREIMVLMGLRPMNGGYT